MEPGLLALGDGLLYQMTVFIFFGSLENERWVSGGVLRLVGLHRFEIAGVGNHAREAFELFQLSCAHVEDEVGRIDPGGEGKERKGEWRLWNLRAGVARSSGGGMLGGNDDFMDEMADGFWLGSGGDGCGG